MIFITGWMLRYRCFDCNHTAIVEMGYEGVSGVKRILALGDEFRTCPSCTKEKFRMVSANISRSKTIFGESDGVWRCPHHNDSYYPIPIERAFDIIAGSNGIVIEMYKEIARLGMPLKCPKCKAFLKYYRGDYRTINGAF